MRYVAAYLLAVLGGNEDPSEGDIKRILGSVGIEVDPVCLKKVVQELKGKNIEELIAEGRHKMSAMPVGGVVVADGAVVMVPAAGTTAAAAAAANEAPKETKAAETKKEESEPESDEDMGFGLFD